MKAVVQLFSARKQAKKIVKEFNPDIVIGAGGYVTAPVIWAAKKLGHKIYNLPSAKIVHLESQTLSSQTKKLQLFFESRKLFYLKNRTKKQLQIANLILKINSIIRICIFYILQKKEKVNYWKTILLQCS